jgi:hypothetical protein
MAANLWLRSEQVMRTASPALIGAALVALGVGCALALPDLPGGSFGPRAALAGPQTSSGTIAELVARGGSWTCNVSRVTGNEQTQGTLHVGGGKMRGDFTAQSPKGPIESHMISDGKTMYVWSSARPQGFKMAAPAAGKAGPPANSQAKLYNQNVDYACSPWTVDAAEFELPAGITFADMSAVMGRAKAPGGAAVPGMNCALCDQAPKGPARDQCRAAMHCQ